MIRAIVIGDDISAVVSAWILSQHPRMDVWLIGNPSVESRQVEFERTQHTIGMLKMTDIPWSEYHPQIGMILRGGTHDYPDVFEHVTRQDSARVMSALMLKVGGSLDRYGADKRRARCDESDLVNTLMEEISTIPGDWELKPGMLRSRNLILPYDFAILSESVSKIRNKIWFGLPETKVCTTIVANVDPRERAYRRWDVVLTPHTPGGAVYKLSPLGDFVRVYCSRNATQNDLISDLNFLFPGGYAITQCDLAHYQHEIPVRPIVWPEQVIPIGPKSMMRPVTMTDVIESSYALLRRWFR